VSNVVIYTTRTCAYCGRAKDLLKSKGIAFSEVDVSEDDATREWLFRASGQRTVPQIFINDQSVGGFQELCALNRKGELERMVASKS
jgi:glutaredoxin 3